MTANTFPDMDINATEYRRIHPSYADLDLRIFKSLCEGKLADIIGQENDCDRVSVCASLCRLGDYLTSGDLFATVEMFRYVFYNTSLARPAPDTMMSVIDILYHAASENGMVPNEVTQPYFSQLLALTNQTAPEIAEDIIDTVCTICNVFEHMSFTEGVKIGFQLGKELTT